VVKPKPLRAIAFEGDAPEVKAEKELLLKTLLRCFRPVVLFWVFRLKDARPSAPKGRRHISPGKRSAALGIRQHKSEALKGRRKRFLTWDCCLGHVTVVSPFQGFSPGEQRTQGDVWRLTPPHLLWADMSRPFRAENTGLTR
jgi:hypothetical protein